MRRSVDTQGDVQADATACTIKGRNRKSREQPPSFFFYIESKSDALACLPYPPSILANMVGKVGTCWRASAQLPGRDAQLSWLEIKRTCWPACSGGARKCSTRLPSWRKLYLNERLLKFLAFCSISMTSDNRHHSNVVWLASLVLNASAVTVIEQCRVHPL